MTKKILSIILISCFTVLVNRGYSQTVAMDFNQADCAGTQHNLFDKLDNGKVVVITYVMLGCSPCIIGTAGIKSLLPAFEASHPGRVGGVGFAGDIGPSGAACGQASRHRGPSTMCRSAARPRGRAGGLTYPFRRRRGDVHSCGVISFARTPNSAR